MSEKTIYIPPGPECRDCGEELTDDELDEMLCGDCQCGEAEPISWPDDDYDPDMGFGPSL